MKQPDSDSPFSLDLRSLFVSCEIVSLIKFLCAQTQNENAESEFVESTGFPDVASDGLHLRGEILIIKQYTCIFIITVYLFHLLYAYVFFFKIYLVPTTNCDSVFSTFLLNIPSS